METGIRSTVEVTAEGREEAVEGGSGGDLRLVAAPVGFLVLGAAATDMLVQLLGGVG